VALGSWHAQRTHSLRDAQELLGRLQHICFVLPMGCAYLVWLQIFTGLFNANSERYMPHTPPHRLKDGLDWWEQCFRHTALTCKLCGPVSVRDVQAYFDASTGIGIAVVLGNHWQAWHLLPGWQEKHRGIQCAEAVSFELICHYAFDSAGHDMHLRIWHDNTGVVKGWWRGRTGNVPTNKISKRLSQFLHARVYTAHTCYVESAQNPADDPSQGVYGGCTPYSFSCLLAPIALPTDVAAYIVDFDAPTHQRELGAHLAGDRCQGVLNTQKDRVCRP
jgi:hypothetical protein